MSFFQLPQKATIPRRLSVDSDSSWDGCATGTPPFSPPGTAGHGPSPQGGGPEDGWNVVHTGPRVPLRVDVLGANWRGIDVVGGVGDRSGSASSGAPTRPPSATSAGSEVFSWTSAPASALISPSHSERESFRLSSPSPALSPTISTNILRPGPEEAPSPPPSDMSLRRVIKASFGRLAGGSAIGVVRLMGLPNYGPTSMYIGNADLETIHEYETNSRTPPYSPVYSAASSSSALSSSLSSRGPASPISPSRLIRPETEMGRKRRLGRSIPGITDEPHDVSLDHPPQETYWAHHEGLDEGDGLGYLLRTMAC